MSIVHFTRVHRHVGDLWFSHQSKHVDELLFLEIKTIWHVDILAIQGAAWGMAHVQHVRSHVSVSPLNNALNFKNNV